MRKRVQFLGALLWTGMSLVAADVSFEEKLLLKTTTPVGWDEYAFSPDGRLLAYSERTKDRKYVLVVGDKKGEPFDVIQGVTFCSDCKTVAYEAGLGNKRYFVIGDQKVEAFDIPSKPVFSERGNSVAYGDRKTREMKKRVVFNGKPGEWFDTVDDLMLNPDGTTVAYSASQPNPQKGMPLHFMVVNDKKGEAFYSVSAPIFSTDGKSVAYIAANITPDGKSEEWYVVVDDKKSEVYPDRMAWLSFIPNGKEVAFIAKKGGKLFIVMGEKKIEDAELFGLSCLVVSPDGKTAAYDVATKTGWCMVVGDKRGAVFEGSSFGVPVFSPDSTMVSYWVEKGGNRRMVVGDKVGEEFKQMGQPFFSPVGNKVVYPATDEAHGYMVVDGRKQEGTPLPFSEPPPSWSPDGSCMAYRVTTYSVTGPTGQYVIAGDKKSEEFKYVTLPVFSPDGKKVAFGARKDYTDPKTNQSVYELWWKVIDLK